MARTSSSSSRDLRHRVLTCMTKLSDRDTHAPAVSELESIIPTLTADTFSLFINSLSSTSASDSAATRAASLRLLAALSFSHAGDSLSSHLPKLISAVVRRLRDQNSTVRSTAATTTGAFAGNITGVSFSSSVLRPLSDSLATEQDVSAQSAAAMCLAAAIDAVPEIEAGQIVRLMPKWMKLMKCEGFKAKSAIIGLVQSSIRVCEFGNCNMLRDLVKCLMEFLKSNDWAARKAAAEALKEIAVVESDSLSDLKASCLKIFESKKFDRVKAVREAMIQLVEAWNEIPDVLDDGSPPPQSQASSTENASDAQTRRNNVRRSSPPYSATKTTATNRSAAAKRSSQSFRKLDFKKHSSKDTNVTDVPHSSVTLVREETLAGDDNSIMQKANFRPLNPETKRGIFSKNPSSRVVPYSDDTSVDVCRQHRDCEGISLIRKQLVQIENQQSSLMDLLQNFIRSSHEGMRCLETRVHGLESALDDISCDLTVSNARMFNPGPPRTSWRFWRRPEVCGSTTRFSFSGTTHSPSVTRNISERRSPAENAYKLDNRRFGLRGAGGVIVNPLASSTTVWSRSGRGVA